MAIRLLALDLDGTVLGPDMKPVAEATEAISEAVSQGIRVMLATGRRYASSAAYAREIGLPPGPIIVYNGAVIRHFPEGGVIAKTPLPMDVARRVIDLCRQRHYYLLSFIGDDHYASFEDHRVNEYARIAGAFPSGTGDLREFLFEEPSKMLIMGDEEQLREARVELEQELGDRLSITCSFHFMLEINDYRANKARALEHVTGMFGFKVDEVMAMGDSLNDIEMIRWAGLGVTMSHADETVKRAANWVTQGGCGIGVAEAIRRFVLKTPA